MNMSSASICHPFVMYFVDQEYSPDARSVNPSRFTKNNKMLPAS